MFTRYLPVLIGTALLSAGALSLAATSKTSPAPAAAPPTAEQSPIPSGPYMLDKTHGFLMFTYLHQGYSHPIIGFDAFDVRLTYNAEQPEKSSVWVNINPDSVHAGSDIFHEHLTGPKWFDVAKFPEIRFVSSSIVRADGDGKWKLNGNLTMKGITKPVSLDATLNRAGNGWWNNVPMLGFSARGTIKRSDWGLSEYIPQISDEVEIMIEVELLRDKAGK